MMHYMRNNKNLLMNLHDAAAFGCGTCFLDDH
jgi:hypothetical protein